MSNLILKIGGNRYDGWTDIQMQKSMFSITGSFSLGGTDIFPNDFQKWGFSMGDPCKVQIDNQTIINGYVEDIPIFYDAKGHNIQISGRDKTGDLVDCSFIETDQEWKGQSVAQIVTNLCAPFGIGVVTDSSVLTEAFQEPKETFKAQMGMSIFEMIKPMLDDKAILPVAYADGNLTLTRAGAEKTYDSLELGKNIKSGNINQSFKDRFSRYIVKGQGIGNDDKDIASYTGPEGIFNDEEVTRYRPLIILPDNEINSGGCRARAQWEYSNRAGASISVSYEVQDWVQSNGQIWPLNAKVPVKDHFLGINGTMLIVEVLFGISNDSGKTTILSLLDPNALDFNQILKSGKNIVTRASWRNKLGGA